MLSKENMIELKEDDLVLCVVERVSGTTVFVKLEDKREGIIVTSEIAPGRIRNLRDYVIPGKRIVCKILKIDKNNVNLSLRRVSDKEKREVMEKYEREKNSLSILKSVVKNAEEIAEKIKKQESLYDFLQSCKENSKKLQEYFTKEETEKILKILQEKREKQVEIKKEFFLSSSSPQGITLIKRILMPYKEKMNYLAAGRFVIKIKSQDYKKANSESIKILQEIQEKAKKENCKFEAKNF